MKVYRAGLLLIVAVLAGCPVKRTEPVPLTGPQSRMIFLGYSVLPPAGENWLLIETGEGKLTFSKRLSGQHVLTATMTQSPLFMNFDSSEDFVSWARQTREKEGSSRIKIVDHQGGLDRSLNAVCSKYHLRTEETPEREADSRRLIVESNGYSCMHPSAPSLFVTIDFTEQYNPVIDTPVGKTEGALLIKTFMFRSIEQDVLARWVSQ